ncbi:MAG: hypothetical protein JNL74_15825, partial [Fibrobacteres bacterium]|nr:hypothetical protein [Fibrobacterota bacterium]
MSKLTVIKGELGPQHRIIENEFYKVETLPQSGQIWHMWNKVGSNTDWYHEEWAANYEKRGDPCHWAPNSWVGYPGRVGKGFENVNAGEIDMIDWHYAFGWDNPETVIKHVGDTFEIKRSGVIPPHPEHSDMSIFRETKALIWGEVTYRFTGDSPYIWQSSRIRTLAPVPVFFIRNCQFVFLVRSFTHLVIAPDDPTIKPGDDMDVSILPIMANYDLKPFVVEHSLSNILPSKLAFTGFLNDDTRDGFAVFQLKEENTNVNTGKPTYGNHCTLYTDLKDWAAYFCRAFSYTNQRFNPENMMCLPAGEDYYEENLVYPFRHETFESSISHLSD